MDRQRVVERTQAKGEGCRRAAGVRHQSASCPQLKYLEVLRWSGELERRTSFMSSLVSSSFCSSLASQVCLNDLFRKCIGQSSCRENPEQWSIPDDIIYELVLYTKYHYSKAPSPGVNDCFVSFVFFWNRFTCKIILISIQPREICNLNRILQLSPQRALLMTRLILEMDILMTEC